MNKSLYVRRVRLVADQQSRALNRAQQSMERATTWAEISKNEMLEARKIVTEGLEAAKQSLAALECMSDDPVVLVRDYGQTLGLVFHDAEKPCGRVHFRENFVELFYTEAAELGISCCSACAWQFAAKLRVLKARQSQ